MPLYGKQLKRKLPQKKPLDPESPSAVFGFRCPERVKAAFEKLSRLTGYKSPSAYLQELVRRELLRRPETRMFAD